MQISHCKACGAAADVVIEGNVYTLLAPPHTDECSCKDGFATRVNSRIEVWRDGAWVSP